MASHNIDKKLKKSIKRVVISYHCISSIEFNSRTRIPIQNIKDKMFTSVLFASALIASACAIPAGPPPPGYHAAPAHKPVHYDPKPYAYAYGVTDEYHGVNFGEDANSDGKAVHGSYHVLLPDGRVQTVKYTADHYAGYIADVSYAGAAKPYHPPKHAKPAPYHPAPVHG